MQSIKAVLTDKPEFTRFLPARLRHKQKTDTLKVARFQRRSRGIDAKHQGCPNGQARTHTISSYSSSAQTKNGQANAYPSFGAEDEIRTRATVSHTTPLAGEPLEPLGYFCIHACGSFKRYNTITYFFLLVKRFLGRKHEKICLFLLSLKKVFSKSCEIKKNVL